MRFDIPEYSSVRELLDNMRARWADGVLNKVRKDHPNFVQHLDQFIENTLADREEISSLDQLYEKFLGGDAPGTLLRRLAQRSDIDSMSRVEAFRDAIYIDYFEPANVGRNIAELKVLGPLIGLIDFIHEQAANPRLGEEWQELINRGQSLSEIIMGGDLLPDDQFESDAQLDADAGTTSGFPEGNALTSNMEGLVLALSKDGSVHEYEDVTRVLGQVAEMAKASTSEGSLDAKSTVIAEAADRAYQDKSIYDRVDMLNTLKGQELEEALAEASLTLEQEREQEQDPEVEADQQEEEQEDAEGVPGEAR